MDLVQCPYPLRLDAFADYYEDCGVDLHGDFLYENEPAFTELANSLQNGAQTPTIVSSNSSQQTQPPPSSCASVSEGSNDTQSPPSQKPLSSAPHQASTQPTAPPTPTKFLALCVDSGGMYKTLHEIDVSHTRSDTEAFL
ncbi:hypothetical protein B0T14DRAFT_559055 [Immersiella caudata]|uniref:Uncharacterized protein n=1 Tax=Immersiella caudata TaxID=314043 RepID=A0AA40CA71_9PEZI|nr:hypothetical protein B0T14DRAFT_559055 [Immersiella caudata]